MGAEARALIAGSLMGMIGAVGAAITAEAQETAAEGPSIVGIEQGDLPTAMQGAIQALHDRQTALEAALRDLEARIARGEDPLVSLEIEQLWTVIGSLERENALLREELEALRPSAGN